MNSGDFRQLTLLADGPTDRSLIPIIRWVWEQHFPNDLVEIDFADLSATKLANMLLRERLPAALRLYPCDVLFIHRDAEKQAPELRYEEVREAIAQLPPDIRGPAHICVVPVRMSEAWMFSDVQAIRKAAGNPNGKEDLEIPPASMWESLPDPKAALYSLLEAACGLPARRRQRFGSARAANLVTSHTGEFSALRRLPAFQRMESDVRELAGKLSVI